jgi:hypothetical protein
MTLQLITGERSSFLSQLQIRLCLRHVRVRTEGASVEPAEIDSRNFSQARLLAVAAKFEPTRIIRRRSRGGTMSAHARFCSKRFTDYQDLFLTLHGHKLCQLYLHLWSPILPCARLLAYGSSD